MNRYLITNVNRLLLFCAGVALVVMMLTVCFNVGTKYMFDFPIVGTLEITAYYYMPITVCLALAPVQMNAAHISVELLTNRCTGNAARVLRMLNLACCTLFCVIVAVGGWRLALNATHIRESVVVGDSNFLVWPGRWVTILGFAVMAWFSISSFIGALRNNEVAHSHEFLPEE